MNDNDLMTAVREEFAPVRMGVAADTIMARGRAQRRLRRSRVAAGVLAVGLGAGLGIPALMSGNATGGATLAAWTVARQTDGSVTVTIREMRNLPALQAKLAADGARVAIGLGAVTTAGGTPIATGTGAVTAPAWCLAPTADQAATPAALAFHDQGQGYYLVIHPAKIPAGDMVRVGVTEGGGPVVPGSPALPGLFISMVRDSAGCGF